MASFTVDITRWVGKVQSRGTALMQNLALDGFSGLVENSPIRTQRFRDSWRVGVDAPDKSVEADRHDVLSPLAGQGGSLPPDSAVLASAANAIANIKWGSSVYITNDLFYGPALERGYSRQAPNGMLFLTHGELVNALNRLLRSSP